MRTYKNLSAFEKFIIYSVPVIFILGCAMHFIYELSEKNKIVALFAPVNESVWEHSKMALFPIIIIWCLYYLFKGKKYLINKDRFFTSAAACVIFSIIAIPMFYYFYTSAFGTESVAVDIIIFFLVVLLGQILGHHFYVHSKSVSYKAALAIFIIVSAMFMVFTYFPPSIPLFSDQALIEYITRYLV